MLKILLVCLFSLFISSISYAQNPIDPFILQTMQQYHIPALSLSIIDQGKIVYTRTYSILPNLPVSENSLFQSASISKSLTAYGALKLVDEGKLNLDQDVNSYLKSWQIPANPYTQQHKVTLRNILDMTSGLSVSGFLGSSTADPVPTLKQILNGEPPAENQPVKVQFVPGSRYFYSGGSYEVLEQMIEDVTHQSFSKFMAQHVLHPLAMTHSQFIAILPKSLWQQAVPGFLKNDEMIPLRWKSIPALGAAGMWTTSGDIAKFAIDVMKSYRGEGGLISKQLAKQMLTRQQNTDFGLGVVISGCGKNLNFRKEGHNIGFYNWLIAFPNTRQGAVVMTNSEHGIPAIKAIMEYIAKRYNWPDFYPITDESQQIPMAC